jgi:chemotaxis protein methyltransferase CheR
MLKNNNVISKLDTTKLTEFIKKEIGYDLTNYAPDSLRRRINNILNKYHSKNTSILIEQLSKNTFLKESIISEITVNFTEMFRDPPFWFLLRKIILEEFFKKEKPIRVWHVGCSNGEEAYAMSILLDEMNFREKVQIFATDIDKTILSNAKKGLYPINRFKTAQKNYLKSGGSNFEKHFFMQRDHYSIKKHLKDKIVFAHHDIVTNNLFRNKFDLILCRNVLIYFNQNLQNHVLGKLNQSLSTLGILAIGSNESLLCCENFEKFTVIDSQQKIYSQNQGSDTQN